jgi:hypothetical protein
MIIKLTGGLGNQMFQYAYGRSISIEKGVPLKYYFVHHLGDTNRQYELGTFDIKGKKICGLIPEMLRKVGFFFSLGSLHIVSGYWQSEKYFIRYEKEIRKDFQFKKPLDKKNNKVLNEIKRTDSVSVHVRRGDYISDEITNAYHGAPPQSYYEDSVSYIKKSIKNPKFFVFSDEPEWVKNNLIIKGAKYIDWNKGRDTFKDLWLMSYCKHNIIANSSFSWWGAWLNTNPRKIVIAPKKWFENKEAQIKIGNKIIPKEWLKK